MRLRLGFGMLALAAAAAWAQPAQPAPPASPAPPAQPAPPPAARARARAVTAAIGETETSYLGIGTQDINSERAKALNLKEERGAEVTKVYEDSPAAKAGFKENDVVLEYNGQAVQGTEQLARMVRETPPDRQVKIVVSRGGATQTLTATIGTRKDGPLAMLQDPMLLYRNIEATIPQFTMPDIPNFQMNWQNPRLGIMGEALAQEAQLAEFFGVKEGVLVKSVASNSPAEKAGIKAGDVIVKVGDTKVGTTDEITRALRSLTGNNNTLTVTVVRNKKEMPLTVTIASQSRGSVRAVARVARV